MHEQRDRLLVVEDDPHLRHQIVKFFQESYEVLEAAESQAAMELLKSRDVDVVLVDMRLPPDTSTIREGLRALESIKNAAPRTLILAMSGDSDRSTCLKAVEAGAYDFFTKPIDTGELQIIVRRALERRRMDRDLTRLQEEVEKRYDFSSLMGSSPAMEQLKSSIRKVAESNASILILGESGTGKELVARAIHFNSHRKKKPFVAVNCAAFPENLVEDELFGHEKGAFTGADRRREGRFEMADGGTLFLDEIGTLTPAVQSKLLRVLESREFERLGGKETVSVDIRLLSATNQDLVKTVSEKQFREDLYYRIKVVQLDLPALRDRNGDVRLLAGFFLKRLCERNGVVAKHLGDEAMAVLSAYRWPGNVRELEHMMESLSLMADGPEIVKSDLPGHLLKSSSAMAALSPGSLQEGILWQGQVEGFERGLLEQALEQASGKKSDAAQLLGLKRDQMKYLCRKYGL